MHIQLKTNHLPIRPIILATRHQPCASAPAGILSTEELRRIVADMVD